MATERRGSEMNQERLDEINRMYHSSGRGLMWDTIRELVAEVERLRKEVNALENKPLNLYLDRELENERLQAEVDRLKGELARLQPSPDSRSYADEEPK